MLWPQVSHSKGNWKPNLHPQLIFWLSPNLYGAGKLLRLSYINTFCFCTPIFKQYFFKESTFDLERNTVTGLQILLTQWGYENQTSPVFTVFRVFKNFTEEFVCHPSEQVSSCQYNPLTRWDSIASNIWMQWFQCVKLVCGGEEKTLLFLIV